MKIIALSIAYVVIGFSLLLAYKRFQRPKWPTGEIELIGVLFWPMMLAVMLVLVVVECLCDLIDVFVNRL